jgi:hypothetical protein
MARFTEYLNWDAPPNHSASVHPRCKPTQVTLVWMALLLVASVALAAPPKFAGVALVQVGPAVTTYIDSTVVDGVTYEYSITAVGPTCPARPVCGESLEALFNSAPIPATGTHTVTLTWSLSSSSGIVGQNIYRAQIPTSPIPQSTVVN